jgi:DNA-binding transcriptional LysR family regulator
MPRDSFSDLVAFLTVAREASFTRAAAKLGVSQSALSHTIRGLETRIGLRLLARTTRSVAPTEAGERLLQTIGPRLDDIEAELAALTELRDRPGGTIRLNAGDHPVDTILLPKLPPFLAAYPDIKVEIVMDQGLSDIVSERFDAGIRLGEQVHQDMIATRIGPDVTMAAVGSPAYLAGRPMPQVPQDLVQHRCVNLRLQTQGGLYAWEFSRGGRHLRVRVEGQLVFNRTPQIVAAALAGMGLAMVPLDRVAGHIAQGLLVPVLPDWWQSFPGHHLYYPSRRQPSAAFALLVEALRWRG